MSTLPLNLNGYTDLPDDKIAFIVTFLEMNEKPARPAVPEPAGVQLERWAQAEPAEYIRLFKEIGTDWLWFSRLTLPEDELGGLLSEPTREIYSPVRGGQRLGLLEIDYEDRSNPEVAYFGLVPDAIGGGLGRWLMNQAIDMAWARPETERLWLHTCTGDSPQALPFYMACGFRPYRRAIEVAEDPRIAGHLPADVGAHVPYFDSR